jgi:hypothetical protein
LSKRDLSNVASEMFSKVVLPGEDLPANGTWIDQLEVAGTTRCEKVYVKALLVRILPATSGAHA